jgi:hypothetical protein
MSKEQQFTISKALDDVNRHRKRFLPVFVVTFCALEGAVLKVTFSAGVRDTLIWSVLALGLMVAWRLHGCFPDDAHDPEDFEGHRGHLKSVRIGLQRLRLCLCVACAWPGSSSSAGFHQTWS